ncbi:hypothetical protein J6W91_00725 [Candidatus Saccharibacteria bacterium]|nr:hypothetical protein [Candidatus Saccharibacteria bacterium]
MFGFERFKSAPSPERVERGRKEYKEIGGRTMSAISFEERMSEQQRKLAEAQARLNQSTARFNADFDKMNDIARKKADSFLKISHS